MPNSNRGTSCTGGNNNARENLSSSSGSFCRGYVDRDRAVFVYKQYDDIKRLTVPYAKYYSILPQMELLPNGDIETELVTVYGDIYAAGPITDATIATLAISAQVAFCIAEDYMKYGEGLDIYTIENAVEREAKHEADYVDYMIDVANHRRATYAEKYAMIDNNLVMDIVNQIIALALDLNNVLLPKYVCEDFHNWNWGISTKGDRRIVLFDPFTISYYNRTGYESESVGTSGTSGISSDNIPSMKHCSFAELLLGKLRAM